MRACVATQSRHWGSWRPTSLEALVTALGEADLRVEAAAALGRLGDPRAVPALLDALVAGAERIRHSAADALERMAWRPAEAREAAIFAVVTEDWDRAESLGAPAIEPLVAMMGTADHSVRQQTARILGTFGWEPPDARARLQLAIAAG